MTHKHFSLARAAAFLFVVFFGVSSTIAAHAGGKFKMPAGGLSFGTKTMKGVNSFKLKKNVAKPSPKKTEKQTQSPKKAGRTEVSNKNEKGFLSRNIDSFAKDKKQEFIIERAKEALNTDKKTGSKTGSVVTTRKMPPKVAIPHPAKYIGAWGTKDSCARWAKNKTGSPNPGVMIDGSRMVMPGSVCDLNTKTGDQSKKLVGIYSCMKNGKPSQDVHSLDDIGGGKAVFDTFDEFVACNR